jgi:hypothetical protein
MLTGSFGPCAVAQLISSSSIPEIGSVIMMGFTPSQSAASDRLHRTRPEVTSVLSSTPLPGFIGRGLFTTMGSSAASHPSLALEFPLGLAYSRGRGVRLSPDIVLDSCEQPHPQSRARIDHKLGVALFSTLTLLDRRIRFAYAMCRSLPIASFSRFRWPESPLRFEFPSLWSGRGSLLARRLSELDGPALLGVLIE